MTRTRYGALTGTFRAEGECPRVMWSVPKTVGNAVIRNRVRRRLRAALREMTSDGTIVLGNGLFRVATSSSLEQVSPDDLYTSLSELMTRLQQP